MMKIRFRIIPLILYLGLIFFVSSRPNLRPPGVNIFLMDKMIHFMEYFILGVLLFEGIGRAMIQPKFGAFVFLLAVGSSIGALDEMFQSYIPGRNSSIYDFFADTMGVGAGLGIAYLWSMRRRPNPKSGDKLHSGGRLAE
jgi:VanZ family protein